MVGVEIDMVVTDSLEAVKLYEKIFDLEIVEASDLPKGQNEVVFTLYGTRFHLLDENPPYHLHAPTPEEPVKSVWCNILVKDIKKTYDHAMKGGCKEVQAVTEPPDYGVSNAVFQDPFGYIWMLHQLHKVVSHEECIRLWEEQNRKEES